MLCSWLLGVATCSLMFFANVLPFTSWLLIVPQMAGNYEGFLLFNGGVADFKSRPLVANFFAASFLSPTLVPF